MLKASLLQMLSVAESCGLTRLDEAYNQYKRHYDIFFLIEDFSNQNDLFFLIEDFSNQNKALTEEIKSYGLLDKVNGKLYLKDLSIKEVYEVMQCVK